MPVEQEAWFQRLVEAIDAYIEESKRTGEGPDSDRALSLAAGLGPNYVNQLRDRKAVGASPVLKLCRQIGVSATYIFTGAHLTPQAERFLTLFSALPERDQDRLLELAERFAATSESPPPEESPASHQEDG